MHQKWRKGLTCLVVGLLGLFLTAPLYAEDETVYELGTVVIEETSGVKDIAIVNTVTAEEIRATGATNVANALKFSPGIHFSYKNRGYQPVIMQGIGQDQILLLIDGLPVVPGGGELDLNSIPASIISRIDIIKGSSSVLYGPNTMGGVINIVTKKGAQGAHGYLRGEVGENGYNHEAGSISYGEGKFNATLLADHTGRDSYKLSKDFEPIAPEYEEIEDGGDRKNSKFESTNAWGRVGFKPNETSELYLNAFSFNVDREVPPNTETLRPFKRRVDDYQVFGASAAGKTIIDDWLTLRCVAFAQKRSEVIKEYHDVDLTDLRQELPDESHIFGLNLFSDMRLADWNTLSLSVNLKSENLEEEVLPVVGSDTEKKAKAYTVSFGVEDTLRVGSLEVIGGVSYNSRKLHDVEAVDESGTYTGGGDWKDTIDPMVGLSYFLPDNTRLYGSVAQKTTFPAVSRTWAQVDESGNVDIEVYDLAPEKDWITTVGANRLFFDMLDVNLAFFHHDISDKLATDANYKPINEGTLRLYGMEAIFSCAFTQRLSMSVDYSLTKGEGSVVRESEYGDTIDRQLFGFKLVYNIPYIETVLNTYARYTIDNYDDYGRSSRLVREDRKTFDMGLSLTKRFAKHFEAIARVDNILDENIEYEAGQPLAGRTFRLGISYDF